MICSPKINLQISVKDYLCLLPSSHAVNLSAHLAPELPPLLFLQHRTPSQDPPLSRWLTLPASIPSRRIPAHFSVAGACKQDDASA